MLACGTQVQTATGIVIAVEGAQVGAVDGFTLRTADGNVLRFTVARLDVSNGALPAAHLREHLASGEPIVVEYIVEGRDQMAHNAAVRYVDADSNP